jgi:hypothetical protein
MDCLGISGDLRLLEIEIKPSLAGLTSYTELRAPTPPQRGCTFASHQTGQTSINMKMVY